MKALVAMAILLSLAACAGMTGPTERSLAQGQDARIFGGPVMIYPGGAVVEVRP